MIGFLQGKVLHASEGEVLLRVGDTGYEVLCSNSAYVKLVNNGEGAIYTYMAVREDGVYLYGFSSMEEKNMFLKLISVSGVGPKMGITVLSNMALSDLAVSIATSDVKTLSKVKGLGKKTAERIILELREKVSCLDLPEPTKGKKKEDPAEKITVNDDAVIALMSLGLKRSESVKLLKEAEENGCIEVEEQIAYALRHL
ncbi:MAG: Holliday junction branch migration protein RuvA [Clostridia bacterium]|nr:Holliday junction branch migration protein RuvA [Clostridia bacterium]